VSTLEKIHDAIRAAEEAHDANKCKEHLLTARTILAEAVVAGESPDRTRIEQLFIRAGNRGRAEITALMGTTGRSGIPWASFGIALADYLQSGGVPMPDGRVATADGWNTENCPPDGTQLLGS